MRRFLLTAAISALAITAFLPGSALAASPVPVIEAPDNAWFTGNPTISFHMTDADGDFGGFRCGLIPSPTPPDESLLSDCGTGESGTFTPAPAAGDGIYQFAVLAYDDADNGNLGSIFVHIDSTIVDVDKPVLSLTGPPSLINYRTPSFTSSVTDAHLQKIECSYDGGTTYEFCLNPEMSNLADGSYAVILRAVDAKGNSDFKTASFTVDATPPTIVLTGLASGQVVPTPFPDFSLSSPDASSMQCYYDNNPALTCDAVGHSATGLPDGAHTMHLIATDLAGNQTTQLVPFTVDASLSAPDNPPLPTLPRPSKVNLAKSGAKLNGSFKIPSGVDPSKACQGKVKLTAAARKSKGAKIKKFTKRASLKRKGSRCVFSTKLNVPRGYKGKRAKTTVSFPGNIVIGKFAISGRVTL